MRQYATAAELAAYPGGSSVPADDADARLRTASRVVDVLLRGVVYDTDATTLMPTDPDVAATLRDATCAIAVEAQAAGAFEAGATAKYTTVSIGNVSLSGREAADGAVSVAGIPVPAEAVLALQSLGNPTVYVGAPGYPSIMSRVAR